MVGAPEPDDRLEGTADLWDRLSTRIRRAWATDKGRRRIVISTGLIIAVVTIAVVASLFASLAGESQSYKDGYSAGGTAYSAYGESNVPSEQACRDEETGPGGRPAHDNPAEWVQGCVAGFNLAQSDN
jgi:hypothetical protein